MIGLFNPFTNLGVQMPSIVSPNIRMPGGFTYNYAPGPVNPATMNFSKPTTPVNYAPLPPIQWGPTPTIVSPGVPSMTQPGTQPAVTPTNPMPNQTFNWAQPTGTQFRPSTPGLNQTFNWGFNLTGKPTPLTTNTTAKTPVTATKTK